MDFGDIEFDRVFERTPLTKSRKKEKWKLLPTQRKFMINKPVQKRTMSRERTQSLYSFGDNLKKRHQLLTLPVSENPHEYDKRPRSFQTLPRTSRPSKRFTRLNTLLLEAVRYQEESEIEKLIIAGANPNATCCVEHISACHIAAMRSDGALALLLSHGADKLRTDRIGRTPLHLAAWAGNVRQVAMLLGFSKDLTNRVSNSMLSSELVGEVKNLSQFVKQLVNVKCSNFTQEEAALNLKAQPFHSLHQDWIDNTIDHNCKDFDKSLPLLQPGWTPLHAASSRAKAHCAKLLLAAGADACMLDLVGRSPLDIAGSTYYTDDHVDPHDFAETVSLLTAEKHHFSIRNRKTFDSPLHTAVELDSVEAVRVLLSIGVPIDWLNRLGLTPLHVAVKNKLADILQVLIHDRFDEKTNYPSAVNLIDKDGRTILHAAVLGGWEAGVTIALEAGITVNIKDGFNETALHLAATIGDLNILNKIIVAAKTENIFHETNSHGETPLIKSVIEGHLECLKRLLQEKSSIRQTLPNQINVFHLAAERGFVDVLQVLLDHDYTLTRGMINFLAGDADGFGPIHYAVQNNHPQCVKLLLSRNAFRSLKTSLTGIHHGSTPLHIAAINNNVEIAKIILKNNQDTVHYVNDQDWTPLHTACNYGSRDMIELLLKEGADLSRTAKNNKIETTPIDLIMNNISNPTEFMSNIFDKCIYTNNTYIQHPNCEVTVDYKVLLPYTEERQQMKVIQALLKTGDRYKQTHLLVHPLLESFLHIKWKALLPFLYTMIITYGVYVMYLTVYVMIMFFYKDNGYAQPTWSNPIVLAVTLYIACFVVLALEAWYINIHTRYIFKFEYWVKFGSIVLALSLPSAIVSTVDQPTVEYPRYIATVSLLLSWLEMMFLLSRFPTWGYYLLMFGKVSCNVLKILSTFSFLVIGFSISFMVMFRHQSPFENPWAALIKTLVMLTSEYDYGDLVEEVKNMNFGNSTATTVPFLDYSAYSLLIIRSIFLIFLILAAIVLMNLMVGVAVNDLQNLQMLGNVRRLTNQVEFQVSLDRLLYNKYAQKFIPKSLRSTLTNWKTIDTYISLRPSEPNSKLYNSLPSDLKNALFEKAQMQLKQMEEDMGTQTYKKKLDEIYDVILKIPEIANKSNYDTRKSNRSEVIEKHIADLEARMIVENKQYTQSLNDMRTQINTLEMKMDMILDRMTINQSPGGKNFFKVFKSDKC